MAADGRISVLVSNKNTYDDNIDSSNNSLNSDDNLNYSKGLEDLL